MFTRQTLPDGAESSLDRSGKVGGLSLHAGVRVRVHQRCQARTVVPVHEPPGHLAEAFIAYSHGNVRYELKTPYRDGTTHVVFEPLDFIARLAALVPKPRVDRTRSHGAFAPNSKYRARLTPSKKGTGGQWAKQHDDDFARPNCSLTLAVTPIVLPRSLNVSGAHLSRSTSRYRQVITTSHHDQTRDSLDALCFLYLVC